MIVTNITDRNGNAPKVIGIGTYWLMPGEEKEIPDRILMVDETDQFGNPTGKKILLPAVAVQQSHGMITVKEKAPAKVEEPPKPSEEDEEAKKKAEAAAKRAATRAAKKAAQEQAE